MFYHRVLKEQDSTDCGKWRFVSVHGFSRAALADVADWP
jgi:hypothetical protein